MPDHCYNKIEKKRQNAMEPRDFLGPFGCQEEKLVLQEINAEENCVVVRLSGSVCANEANMVRATLFGYLEKGHNFFVVDFGGVDSVDKTALGILYSIHKRVGENDGRFIIRGLRGLLKDKFELTQMDRVFDIH